MKHFFLVANQSKQNTETVAKQIVAYLKERDAICTMSPVDAHKEEGIYKYTDARMIPDDTEAVIVLGGDGTLIQAARDLAHKNLPLLGINMGTLGYLTQGGIEEIPQILDALLQDRCWTENRMLLSGRAHCFLDDGTEKSYEDIAFNDIVITRRGSLRMLRFQLLVNGELLSDYNADGMIIATPTGSTAYNLSAGGPIVDPKAEMILLTPICAHTLNSRSIVLSASDQVQIRMKGQEKMKQSVIFDGDTEILLNPGDFIEVKRADAIAKIIKLKRSSFVERLMEKLSYPVT